MKNYTQKRLKKQQKKVFFSSLERAYMLPKSRMKGPQQGLAWKPQKTAAWSNLEYYFYYIGTNASLKGLRSRGFPSFHPVLLLASTHLPGIYGSNAETDSGPCSVPVWDMQSSRSIVAMLFFNQRWQSFGTQAAAPVCSLLWPLPF